MTATDYLVLNWDQKVIQDLAKTTKAQLVPFSSTQTVPGAYQKEGKLYFHEEFIMAADTLGVPGNHNVENALAAIAVAKLRNISNEDIKETLQSFSGVPHRTQFVGTINERRFFNDSKATNILATEMALSGFDHEKLILLAGGLDRGNSFDDLIPSLIGLKAIIVFGETKDKLAQAARDAHIPTIEFSENAETAVAKAYALSEPGDTILLSPANASWDQYKNFEIRGDRFIAAVNDLKK